MKKIIYGFLFTLLLTSCAGEELPSANFELQQVESMTATAGDIKVALEWISPLNFSPDEYLITWTSGTAGVMSGSITVEASQNNIIIDDLVNDTVYTFAIQPRYSGELAGKVEATCTPKNSRFAVTGLIAAAGNEQVRLKWTKPASDLLTGYKVVVMPGSKLFTIDDPATEMYMINDLINDTEYTMTITCIYAVGDSDPVSVLATPGLVFPIIVPSTSLSLYEPCTFSYNDLYFILGDVESVNWSFGDGGTSIANDPTHAYAAIDSYTVTATVTYVGGNTESGTITMTVENYRWASLDLNKNSLSGYVKVSNPAFSPDGKTMYIPTSTPNGHLFAIDVFSGSIKWIFQINTVTYGGGSLVGPDGVIYQCGTDKSVYAINADGTQKWRATVAGVIGAFPALSSSGTLYCVSNAPTTLYAINTSNGSIEWEQPLDGSTASAVAVGSTGTVYAATYGGLFTFNAQGVAGWSVTDIVVTDRGAMAFNNGNIYATLASKAGLVSINATTGVKNWTYPTTGGDSFFPIVDKSGNIYFTEKVSQTVHAVKPDGEVKWSKSVGASLTYCGLALGENGMIYCGTQSKVAGGVYKILGLTTADGTIVYDQDCTQQILSGVSIGPDQRLYVGTIGASNIGGVKAYEIGTALESNSWSTRGGDASGTNRQK